MSHIVRQSKFRNLIVKPYDAFDSYEELPVAQVHSASGNSIISAGLHSFAFVCGRGNDIGILSHKKTGKGNQVRTLVGHRGPILHLEYATTDQDLLLSCGDDCEVRFWRSTSSGQGAATPDGVCTHRGKVVLGTWNPVGSGLLASGSLGTVKLWDANRTSNAVQSVRIDTDTGAGDYLHAASWGRSEGSVLGVVTGDKRLSLVDFRARGVAEQVGKVHDGPARMGLAAGPRGSSMFYTTGASRTRDREISGWDTRKMKECAFRIRIDTGVGALNPMVDPDLGLVYLVGKGDTNVRVFEISDSAPYLYGIGNFAGSDRPAIASTLVPKPSGDVMGNEIGRILKLTTNAVEPTRVEVPRKEKGSVFQDDLFGLTVAYEPALSASEWLAQPSSRDSVGPPPVGVKLKFVNKLRKDLNLESQAEMDKRIAEESLKEESLRRAAQESEEQERRQHEELVRDENRLQHTNDRFKAFFGYQAKFKYAKAALLKRDESYFNLWPELPTVDSSSAIAASAKFLALPWRGAGGAVFVQPLSSRGKVDHPESVPLLQGHSGPVYALDFSPVDDSLLASAGEDCGVRVWHVPSEGLSNTGMSTIACEQRAKQLKGHRASVRKLAFHPLASGVLASGGGDATVRLWDVEAAEEKNCFGEFGERVTDLSWSFQGGSILASSRDGKSQLLDPRSGSSAASFVPFGQGVHRAMLVGESDWVLASGFGGRGERVLGLWDPRKLLDPVAALDFEASQAVLVPHFVEENGVVVLAARGEKALRVVEIEGMGKTAGNGGSFGKMHHCDSSILPGNEAPHSFALLPRRLCNVDKTEWAKMVLLGSSAVDVASFTLPRSKDLEKYFADDVYPDTRDSVPVYSSKEWFSGDAPLKGPATTSMNDHGKTPLSARDPVEAKRVTHRGHVKNNEFLKAKEQEERRKQERDATFARMQKLAVQYDEYNPNMSMGAAGRLGGVHHSRISGVDETFQGGDEVADDEWDD